MQSTDNIVFVCIGILVGLYTAFITCVCFCMYKETKDRQRILNKNKYSKVRDKEKRVLRPHIFSTAETVPLQDRTPSKIMHKNQNKKPSFDKEFFV